MSACTRCWRSSPRAESPRKSTLLTSIGSSRRAIPRPRSRRSATTSPSSSSTTSAVSTPNSRCHTNGSATRSARRQRRSPTCSVSGRSSRRSLIGYTGDVDPIRATAITTPPTTAPPRSSSPRPAGSCTDCLGAGTADSTTRSTWSRSASSATRTPTAAPTSIASVAEGKTKKEALRALKRHVSNAVYRQLVADARRARS